MTSPDGYERPAIAGSGMIASGLAATVSGVSEVRLLARSDASAWKVEEIAQTAARKLESGRSERIRVTTNPEDLADCDLIVEAIVEDAQAKVDLLRTLGATARGADVATTTSSLSIGELAGQSSLDGRLYGLHVFNPVTRMELIELCLPEGLADGISDRALAWCKAIDKVAVEVPDTSGFVVNRLLFPYLFDAIRLMERTELSAQGVDDCMRLGAGHPMGPLKLLDFVGLDVAIAIGESLAAESGDPSHDPPETLRKLAADGNLGRKSGAGFFTY